MFYFRLYFLGAAISSILGIIATILGRKRFMKYSMSDAADCLIIGGLLWPLSIWFILYEILKKICRTIVDIVV